MSLKKFKNQKQDRHTFLQYFAGEKVILSPEQEGIVEHILTANSLFRKHGARTTTVKALKKATGFTAAMCQYIVSIAIYIYGQENNLEKNAVRVWLHEKLTNDIKNCEDKYKKTKKIEYLDQKTKLYNQLVAIWDLKSHDDGGLAGVKIKLPRMEFTNIEIEDAITIKP